MKKFKNLISVILVVSLLLVFTVPYSASSLSDSFSYDSKIDSKLKSVMESTTDDEFIEVALWLSDVDNDEREDQIATKIRRAENRGDLTSTFMNETDLSTIGTVVISNTEMSEQAQTLVELKRDVERDLHSEHNTDVLTDIDSTYDIDTDPLFVSSYAPLVLMEMTEEEIYNVVNSESVERIYYHEELEIADESLMIEDEIAVANETESTNQYPYGVWQNSTNIDMLRDAMGFTGSGVKIGALEQWVANFDYTNISSEDRTELYEQFSYHIDNGLIHFASPASIDDNASHANYTLSILSGFTDDYEGVAPLAEVYCAGRGNDGHYFQPIENLIDSGVNVIYASLYWEWAEFDNNYDYVSKYVDYIVSNTSVTLCFSAGNIESENPNNKLCSAPYSFNAITVGNINDKRTIPTNDDEISSSSLYNFLENDTYKPDICAPGTNVSTYVAPNMGGGGTSAACPVVAGTCALLMEAIPKLKSDPMLLKSLLMASAQELENMTDIYSTTTSIDPALIRRYGAGMIDAYKAYETYINGNTRSFNSYDLSFNYAVHVSDKDINRDKDIYLSLNWMQWNTENGDDWDLDNNYNVLNGNHHTLSLYDPDGELVAVSDYHYDRKQFIRHKPLKTGRYTAKITRSNTGILQYYPQFAVAHCIK